MNSHQMRRIVFTLCITALCVTVMIGAAIQAFAQEPTPEVTPATPLCNTYTEQTIQNRETVQQELDRLNDEIETFGDTLERRGCRAAMYLSLGQFARAAMDYDRMNELDTTSPAQIRIGYLLASGFAWMMSGSNILASRAADQIEQYGFYEEAYLLRGGIAVESENYEDAIAFYNAAFEAGFDSATLYLERAVAYTALGRTDEAQRDIEQALARDPQLRAQTLRSAETASNTGNDRLAAHSLRRLVVIDPDSAIVQYSYAFFLFVTNGDDTEIFNALNRAYELDPSQLEALQLLGYLFVRQRNCPAALATFEEYVRQADSASIPTSIYQLIEYLQQAGDECSFRGLDNWLAANN